MVIEGLPCQLNPCGVHRPASWGNGVHSERSEQAEGWQGRGMETAAKDLGHYPRSPPSIICAESCSKAESETLFPRVEQIGMACAGFIEGGSAALVLYEEDAGPEEVEESVVALEVFDGFFEDRDGFEGDAKALEEVDPELVLLHFLVGGVFILACKGDGAVGGLIP